MANLSGIEIEIIKAGNLLAAIDPSSPALGEARQWWRAGRRSAYSNQDFDVLNGLVGALHHAEKRSVLNPHHGRG